MPDKKDVVAYFRVNAAIGFVQKGDVAPDGVLIFDKRSGKHVAYVKRSKIIPSMKIKICHCFKLAYDQVEVQEINDEARI